MDTKQWVDVINSSRYGSSLCVVYSVHKYNNDERRSGRASAIKRPGGSLCPGLKATGDADSLTPTGTGSDGPRSAIRGLSGRKALPFIRSAATALGDVPRILKGHPGTPRTLKPNTILQLKCRFRHRWLGLSAVHTQLRPETRHSRTSQKAQR